MLTQTVVDNCCTSDGESPYPPAHRNRTFEDSPVRLAASKPIRVMLANHHRGVRRAVNQLLDEKFGFQIAAEADDLAGLLGQLREDRPDVLIIDLSLSGEVEHGVATIHAEFPDVAIVVLTMENEPAYVRRALRDGALGYVLIEAAGDDLVAAVRAAGGGQRYLSPRTGAKLAADVPASQAHGTDPVSDVSPLTAAQQHRSAR